MRVVCGFDYVLILELLGEGDALTGSELHAFLPTCGFPSKLVICRSCDDVVAALNQAVRDTAALGIPVVHLETHGSDPMTTDPYQISFGNADSGMTWGFLGTSLVPLNVASDFRLLVVSAACWGAAIIAAMGGGEHAAPFAHALGFQTKVGEGRLRDAMKELYRCLKSDSQLAECVESAQRELDKGQRLKLYTAPLLAFHMTLTVFRRRKSINRTEEGRRRFEIRAREVWNTWFPPQLQSRDPAYRFENLDIDSW